MLSVVNLKKQIIKNIVTRPSRYLRMGRGDCYSNEKIWGEETLSYNNKAFSLTWPTAIFRFYIRSLRTGLQKEHGCHFIVLEHQDSGHDVV